MKATLLLAPLLTALAAASPMTLVERAGGPIAKPIPKSCTVTNPLPGRNGFKPSPAFVKANLVYEAYFETAATPRQQARICAQQCYGYGVPGDCKSSFFAQNVPVPKGYYGSPGGQLEEGCLLFSEFLEESDFVAAKPGTYIKASASDIDCP